MAAAISKNKENTGKARWEYFRGNTTHMLVGFNLTFGVVTPLARAPSECALLICWDKNGDKRVFY